MIPWRLNEIKVEWSIRCLKYHRLGILPHNTMVSNLSVKSMFQMWGYVSRCWNCEQHEVLSHNLFFTIDEMVCENEIGCGGWDEMRFRSFHGAISCVFANISMLVNCIVAGVLALQACFIIKLQRIISVSFARHGSFNSTTIMIYTPNPLCMPHCAS